MSEANVVNVTPDPNKDPIRRLTNQELWTGLLTMGYTVADFKVEAIEQELERRLRKIAFLPTPPPKEEA